MNTQFSHPPASDSPLGRLVRKPMLPVDSYRLVKKPAVGTPTLLLALLFVSLALLNVPSGQAQMVVDFTGPFAPDQWFINTQGDSTAAFSGNTSLTMTTPNDGVAFIDEHPGTANVDILIPSDGTLQFNYAGSTADDGATGNPSSGGWGDGSIPNDYVGYGYDGNFVQLSPNSGNAPVSGTITLPVENGKDFQFIVGANYSLNGPATFTVDTFSFTPVPEPKEYALMTGLGLLALAVCRRQRRQVA